MYIGLCGSRTECERSCLNSIIIILGSGLWKEHFDSLLHIVKDFGITPPIGAWSMGCVLQQRIEY